MALLVAFFWLFATCPFSISSVSPQNPYGNIFASGIETIEESTRPMNNEDLMSFAEFIWIFLLEDEESALNITRSKVVGKCQNDIDEVSAGFSRTELWALKMLDSVAKPEGGIFTGNTRFLGNYDECLDVTHTYSTNGTVEFIRPQFCSLGVTKFIQQRDISNRKGINLRLAVCAPGSCHSNELKLIISKAVASSEWKKQIQVNNVVCLKQKSELSTGAVVSLAVVGFLILFMFVGTAYDIFLHLQILAEEKSSYLEITDDTIRPPGTTTTGNVKLQIKLGRGKIAELLLSFSVYTNGKKILATNIGSSALGCVHGIRFLSLTWVMIGHTYAYGKGLLMNLPEANSWTRKWSFQTVDNETVSVDSFFAMSGLLLVYLTLNEMKKRNGKINWVMFYFHRYYRLTLPYGLVIMVYTHLYQYLIEGPLWEVKSPTACVKYWWHNILYINNLTNANGCKSETWYLANDMQFFILSPLLIIPVYFWPKIGYTVWTVFIMATLITTGIVSSTHRFTPAGLGHHFEHTGKWNDIYYRPWCRIGPYLVGMATGYIIFKFGSKLRMPQFLHLFGWCVATATGLSVVYGLLGIVGMEYMDSVAVSAFYNAMSRTAWAIALSWVMFVCATGNGGFVNTILCWKGFLPLSRLGFMFYLLHKQIINLYYHSMRTYFYATDLQMVFTIPGMVMATYAIAFVMSLAFECPTVALEKVIFNRDKRT